MSRNELNSCNDLPKPMDTLDLHGFNKAEAIRRTTDFLDRSTPSDSGNAWVLIITGSGAHSTDGRKFLHRCLGNSLPVNHVLLSR